MWGLRNLGDIAWNVETADGAFKTIEKGQIAPIAAIKTIHFPNGTAVVEG